MHVFKPNKIINGKYLKMNHSVFYTSMSLLMGFSIKLNRSLCLSPVYKVSKEGFKISVGQNSPDTL